MTGDEMHESSRHLRCDAVPAEGVATTNGSRYCHGDGPSPTCYELVQQLPLAA